MDENIWELGVTAARLLDEAKGTTSEVVGAQQQDGSALITLQVRLPGQLRPLTEQLPADEQSGSI